MRNAREQKLDKLNYKKIKLVKYEEKTEKGARQCHVSVRPEEILQNAERRGST